MTRWCQARASFGWRRTTASKGQWSVRQLVGNGVVGADRCLDRLTGMSLLPASSGPVGSAYSPGGPYPHYTASTPHPVPGQRRNRGMLLGVLIAVIMAVAGLAIFGIVYKQTGSAGFVWGTGLAFIPMIVIAALYLWLDRYEPEP